MVDIVMSDALRERKIPFILVEVAYPEPDEWDTEAFRRTAAQTLDALKAEFRDYDRKAVFGEHPYARFFKKFKKTYPVLLQFESCVVGDRPFPQENPIIAVPFLVELSTRFLTGTHDVERVMGRVMLDSGTEKEPFEGMHGEAHTYPNDVVGRDDGGIILSMIAGADARTCARPESRRVFYPLFGVPELPASELERVEEIMTGYVRTLAPGAQIETQHMFF